MKSTEEWKTDDNAEDQGYGKRSGSRFLGLFFAALILLFTAGALFIHWAGALGLALCGNQVITREEQPGDGSYEFVVFKRDCGATTGYSYHLSIINKRTRLTNYSAGNVFVSNQKFDAAWENEHTIIVHGNTSEVFKQKQKTRGIEILYSSADHSAAIVLERLAFACAADSGDVISLE